jgi:nucleoside-diphosphate-sugar epimerase
MRVLVTGAAGCLGRATLERLAARGVTTRGFDRLDRGATRADEWVMGDLLQNDLAPVCRGCDAVVHLAALVHRPDVTDPAAYERANVEGTARLLAASRAAGLPEGRFVLSSTVGVYGRDHDLDADESTPVDPRTPYAVSKLRAEEKVRDRGGVVLRFPVVYGPGDRGNVAQLVRAVARGRFALPGRCDRPRSLVAAANAAEGIARALESAPPGGLYLVTDDHDLGVRALVERIADSLPGKPRPREAPYALVWAAALAGSVAAALGLRTPVTLDALRKLTTRLTFSCARARRELGYRPVLDVDEALRRAVEDALSPALTVA